MMSTSQCYVCGNRTEPEEEGAISICAGCESKHKQLVKGIRSVESQSYPREEIPTLGKGIGWYMIVDPLYFEEFEYGQNVWKQSSVEVDLAIKKAIKAIHKLGVRRSLICLCIHHYAGEIVYSDPLRSADSAGLPSQMFRYGLGLVATVGESDCDQNESTTPSDLLLCTEDVADNKVHDAYFELLFHLRQISTNHNQVIDEANDDINPRSLSYAALDRDLSVSRIAYDTQYIDGMRRQYVPFQNEFMEYFDIDMSKSYEWATELLDRHCLVEKSALLDLP